MSELLKSRERWQRADQTQPIKLVSRSRGFGFLTGSNDRNPSTGILISQLQRSKFCDICNCPAFLLAVGGPWLCVMGGVIIKNVIVQRFTSMEWVVCSSTDEDARVLRVASILWALRVSLKELGKFYEGLEVLNSPSTYQPLTNGHPRFYPIPTTFPFKGKTVIFHYLEALQPDSTCVTFKAEIIDVPSNCEDFPFRKGSFVVVKFVSRYGNKVHTFLAENGLALALHHFGEVPEWKGAVEAHLPHKKPNVQGLVFATSHMVVMDFVDATALEELNNEELGRQTAHILYLLQYFTLPHVFCTDYTDSARTCTDSTWTTRIPHGLAQTPHGFAWTPHRLHGFHMHSHALCTDSI